QLHFQLHFQLQSTSLKTTVFKQTNLQNAVLHHLPLRRRPLRLHRPGCPAPVAEAAPAPVAEAEAEPGVILARSSCQAGSIFGAGDAACSASCIAQGEGFHGGYCSKKAVCHCTH
ncbi:hypothetical protein P168DRAFT_325995, partial [Aspergillus campestris IBT 28561]